MKEDKSSKNTNLKIFFIKLISISIAIVILINVFFNLLIQENFGYLMSLKDLENRRELGSQVRENVQALLKKDKLLKEEDKILLYKLYQKLKSEFKDIDVSFACNSDYRDMLKSVGIESHENHNSFDNIYNHIFSFAELENMKK